MCITHLENGKPRTHDSIKSNSSHVVSKVIATYCTIYIYRILIKAGLDIVGLMVSA